MKTIGLIRLRTAKGREMVINKPHMVEAGIARRAEEFWQLAGWEEPFPRNLVGAASLALPVIVQQISDLSVGKAQDWLRRRGVPEIINGRDRRLRGCLVAYAGHGIVLIDSADPDDERHFTLAHELAHFLLDCWEHRLHVINIMGEGIIPALDGLRPFTPFERMDATLSSLSLGYYVDIFERTPKIAYTSQATMRAEERANRLALELLAPAREASNIVSGILGTSKKSYGKAHKECKARLCQRYGLPVEQADTYATLLLKSSGRSPSIRDWFE